MNTRQHPKLIIRTPPDVNNYMKVRAADNGRSITAEFIKIMRMLMSVEPILAVVRECNSGGDKFFTASLGETSTVDFYEGPSKEEAFAAARAKLKELGFDRAAIDFRTETDDKTAA